MNRWRISASQSGFGFNAAFDHATAAGESFALVITDPGTGAPVEFPTVAAASASAQSVSRGILSEACA